MRVYEMFMGPLQVSKPWSTSGMGGVYRFLDRIWRLYEDREISEEKPPKDLEKTLHKTIKKVTNDTDTLNFNTAISQMMVLVNEIYKNDKLHREVWETLLKLLSPYAPHLAEELWQQANHDESIANVKWPSYNEKLTIDSEIQLVIQVNGKLRSKINVNKDISKEEMIELALNDEKIKSWIEGKTIIKKIAVPKKLVNLVVK